MKTSQIVGAVIGFIVFVLAITWLGQGNEFFLYKVFAPKMEAVRRDTFKESQAYNDGMASQLQNMQFKYEQSDAEAKGTLAPIILATVGSYDTTKLPPDLQAFLRRVKNDIVLNKSKG